MRLGACVAALILLFTALPAEAITCDWRQKIGTCSARGAWVGESRIQFSSDSPCSFIDYRINAFDYYTTVIQGVADEAYERHPKFKGANLRIEITGCTVFSKTDEARRDDTQRPEKKPAPNAAAAAPKPQEARGGDQSAKPIVWCPNDLTIRPNDSEERVALIKACRSLGEAPTAKSKTKTIKSRTELEALRREGEAKIRDARERKAREEQQLAEERRRLQAQQELQRQRQQQTWNAILNAVGAGAGAYNAIPKYQRPQPAPSVPSYRPPKAQKSSGRASGTTPSAPTNSTQCPDAQVVVDENCRPAH